MALDFRANQVRLIKLILSGANTFLAYPYSAALNDSGSINSSLFNTSSIGSDVIFAFSGSSGSIGNASSYGASLFLGDLVVSGTLKVIGEIRSKHNYLSDGTSAFIAGTNITIVSETNGAVTISSTGGGGGTGDSGASYLVLNNTASLTNERRIITGSGVSFLDAGANSSFTVGLNVRTAGFVSISTGSNSEIVISGATQAPTSSQYLVLSADPVLTNERVFTTGSGISVVDAGAGGAYTVGLNVRSAGFISISTGSNSEIILSGATQAPSNSQYLVLAADNILTNERVFTSGKGISVLDAGAGGAYTVGLSIVAGPNITITTQSNAIAISSSYIAAPISSSYLVLGADAVLTQERVFTPGEGISIVDAGAGGTYTVGLNVKSQGPLLISSGSGTEIILSASTFAPTGSQYLVLTADNILTNERIFTTGSGISVLDAGAGGAYTVGLNIIAGPNITITTQSNGVIAVSGSASSSGSIFPAYTVGPSGSGAPYTSLQTAVSAAGATGIRQVVWVLEGFYTEGTVTLKNFVDIVGIATPRSNLLANDSTGQLDLSFSSDNQIVVSGVFSTTGLTGSTFSVNNITLVNTGSSVFLENNNTVSRSYGIRFVDCHFESSGANTFYALRNLGDVNLKFERCLFRVRGDAYPFTSTLLGLTGTFKDCSFISSGSGLLTHDFSLGAYRGHLNWIGCSFYQTAYISRTDSTTVYSMDGCTFFKTPAIMMDYGGIGGNTNPDIRLSKCKIKGRSFDDTGELTLSGSGYVAYDDLSFINTSPDDNFIVDSLLTTQANKVERGLTNANSKGSAGDISTQTDVYLSNGSTSSLPSVTSVLNGKLIYYKNTSTTVAAELLPATGENLEGITNAGIAVPISASLIVIAEHLTIPPTWRVVASHAMTNGSGTSFISSFYPIYISGYKTTIALSSSAAVAGQFEYRPSDFTSTPTQVFLRALLAASSTGVTSSIRLFNLTDSAYVDISGSGGTFMSSSSTAVDPASRDSTNLIGASNFSNTVTKRYELRLFTSNSSFPAILGDAKLMVK